MEEKSKEDVLLENEELRERLREAEEVLRAIRQGEVDALTVSDGEGEKIYTLSGADRAYRILIDTMSEGALTLSPDGTILYGNIRFETMLGLPLAKVVGTSFFDFIAQEENDLLVALLDKAREESARGEARLLAKDGKLLPVRLSISALELDEAAGFCIVVSDLSEEKRTQEELTRHRDQLEKLVEARTIELTKARRELEARVEERTAELRAYTARLEVMNRELQEFIHIASHDLQEPLRKIQTFCSRIKDADSTDLMDGESRDDLDRVENAAKRMQDLIRALLSYSHVFKQPGPFILIDLNDLVREVQMELDSLIGDAGAKVQCWDLPSIEVEPGQMHRLFKNLIENALKFHRDEPPVVKIYSDVREGAARIFIEDNGMGLDEGYLDRIFKPFQQLHRRGLFEGTGIGLAVCRKIVESHGGIITVESTPGTGSKFIVTLPMRQSSDGIALPKDTLRERSKEDLHLEIYKLSERLRESEEIISAIREGKIDALVSCEPEGERVYTLKSADRGYRLLVESIQEGAVLLSPDGSIYYANPRFEEMLKRDHRKTACSLMNEYVPEEDRGKFETLFREADEGKVARGEIRLRAEDGTLLPVYISLSPLDMEEFRGICVTLTDLTEQKLYLERLERSNRELRDFASIASHDLQEPLRKIQSFGERLTVKCADSLPVEGRDYLERMRNASKRMQAFIQELLNYSRVTTGAAPFRAVDLEEVLRDAVSDLQVRIGETGGRIEIGDLPSFEADPSQMRQLFQNLIGNALKFHGNQKPIVKIHGRVVNRMEDDHSDDAPSGRYCRITVEDNGIGFDEKYVDRIFAPFQRLHGRSEFEGAGMGLAICKKIVERHDGSISAKSEPGKGSTFIIRLPETQMVKEIPYSARS
jgi:PAS domain S-box-containing protein